MYGGMTPIYHQRAVRLVDPTTTEAETSSNPHSPRVQLNYPIVVYNSVYSPSTMPLPVLFICYNRCSNVATFLIPVSYPPRSSERIESHGH